MFVVYDAVGDYHPQDKDYQPGEEVKQADTILLGYPLQFEMTKYTNVYMNVCMYELLINFLSSPLVLHVTMIY